ncbi:MAG: transposase [Candidatus Cloacimonetes bacterium]|nr:transposase [Candidatus Cloacimonadota bacterium]
MGKSAYKFGTEDNAHFCTCTVINWQPAFNNPEIAEIILNSFRYLHETGRIRLYAYVIMVNHLHCIIQCNNIAQLIRNFKSFTARKIIDYYILHQNVYFLEFMHKNKRNQNSESKYQFWEEGVHPEEILSPQMMKTKIDYIHFNPVKAGFVNEPEHWRYSSASNYNEDNGIIEIDKDWGLG